MEVLGLLGLLLDWTYLSGSRECSSCILRSVSNRKPQQCTVYATQWRLVRLAPRAAVKFNKGFQRSPARLILCTFGIHLALALTAVAGPNERRQ